MRHAARATIVTGILLTVGVQVREAAAQTAPRFGLTFEAAGIWSTRNDVRIPPDTGTEFSIVDLIGSGPSGAARVELLAELTERQGLRFVYAPIRVTGRGTPAEPIAFAGGVFGPVPTDAEYQFSSYRVTYRFRIFQGDTWRWRLGFTGFVRDAVVALAQPGASAEDTDVGFVPLAHLSGDARISERWRFSVEFDFAAAPQGRALDLSTLLRYEPGPRWHVAFGYRTVEGGADVDQVFTFAWLNALVLQAGVRF